MIKSVQLQYFRRHEDLSINFSDGLNVIRGANEQGKTTLLEGICYAIFGSAALRDTLSETVTWGQKESKLKTKTVLHLEGVDYTFTRGASGAECNYLDQKVTGQKEVTAFASNLLGADPKTANTLIMASQSGLRGALDAGPTAISALMGKLADFDMIDRLLKNAEKRLSLGSETPVREKLEQAQLAVTEAENCMPTEARIDYFDALVKGSEKSMAEAEKAIDLVLAPAVATAQAAHLAAQQRQRDRSVLVQTIAGLDQQREKLGRTITTIQGVLASRPKPEALTTAAQLVTDAKNHAGLLAAHKLVTDLPAYPVVFWDEPKESFLLEMQRVQTLIQETSLKKSAAEGQARQLARGKITDGKCPTCGHSSTSAEHVAEHNAKVDKEVKVFADEAKLHEAQLAELAEEAKVYAGIDRMGKVFEKVADQLRPLNVPKQIDISHYPPRITWEGEAPRPVNLSKLETALKDLQQADRQATMAEGELQAQNAALQNVVTELQTKSDLLATMPVADVDSFAQAYNVAIAAQAEKAAELRAFTQDRDGYARQRDEVRAEIARAQQALDAARARVIEYQSDLTRLIANNALVAKLKKLKPMITDYLWQTVLAGVSNFFSTLRGEQSVVTKTPDGFRVNDKSIESLSGSTLDVLAIALRVALTKTFIPHASFVTLDEPAHGCDAIRTGNVLGFLSASGFKQVLLASHDELSESVASNVVLMGE